MNIFPIFIDYIYYLVALFVASGLLLFMDGATYKQQKHNKERKISRVFAVLNISMGLTIMVAYWMQTFFY